VMSKMMPVQITLDHGRKLLREGKYHTLIDKILLDTLLEAGLKDSAEDLAHDASRRWPDLAPEFLEMKRKS
jgi:hypothetical protein